MGEHLRSLCRHLCDFGEDLSEDSQALLRERYSALLRQIPWLYGIILANVLGLHLATRGSLDVLTSGGEAGACLLATEEAPDPVRQPGVSSLGSPLVVLEVLGVHRGP